MIASEESWRRLNDTISTMYRERDPWLTAWRDISDYFLPRRYPWLYTLPSGSQGGAVPLASSNSRPSPVRNSKLLDSTSTRALRILATGMMNGITNPARPWFGLTIKSGRYNEPTHPVRVWLDECAKAMHKCMAKTNFYGAMGILYLEFSAFGTASMGIYENFERVFWCRNYALGEFLLRSNAEGQVDAHARAFGLPLWQVKEKWPKAQLTDELERKAKGNVMEQQYPCTVKHLIEPNKDKFPGVRASAKFREIYWLEGPDRIILDARGLDELPTITPRWEVYANDTYGSSPAMEATPDVLQLQHLTKRRAQGLDKLVDPPMLAHSSLATKPKAFIPGGITYVSSQDLQNGGARPTYQIAVPFQELHIDIQTVQIRIKEVLFNDLFRMISDLETVRSASEIDARREEKLVLLGPVLERFATEALRPSIDRIFAIMKRAKLLPPPPPEMEEEELDVTYTGILYEALQAVGTVAVERFLQFIGGVAQVDPNVTQIPDWEEVVRYYADAIGVPDRLLREPAESQPAQEEAQGLQGLAAVADVGQKFGSAAQSLSATDVGGGQNALQMMMGG